MDDKIKKQLDEVVTKVINPEGIAEVISRKLFMTNSPCQKWSFRNLAIVQMHNSFDCRGYKQWQEVGRQVKKGCHAVKILSPKMKTIVVEENGKEVKKKICYGFRPINVFRYEDTEGEALEEYAEVMEAESKKHSLPLYDLAVKMGVSVEYAPSTGSYYGYNQGKKIVLCTDEEQVFYHELAHAIEREIGTLTLARGQQVDNEVVAEFCACFFASMYGKQADIKGTHEYIKGYAGKDHVSKSIFKYMDRVEKVINYVLDFQE